MISNTVCLLKILSFSILIDVFYREVMPVF